jgi:hypothetical protein
VKKIATWINNRSRKAREDRLRDLGFDDMIFKDEFDVDVSDLIRAIRRDR